MRKFFSVLLFMVAIGLALTFTLFAPKKAHGQVGGPPYSCFQTFTVTTAARQTPFSNVKGCYNWRLVYSTNFSSISVLSISLEGAPDAAGAPGSWTAYSGSQLTEGTNPLTSIVSGTLAVHAVTPWVSVNVSTMTGAGTVNVVLYGQTGALASSSTTSSTTTATVTTPTSLEIAIAKTRLGLSDTKILLIGDSTTFGQNSQFGGTYANASSWPSFMNIGTSIPISTCGFGVATGDSRWAAGANWAGQSNLGFGSNGSYQGTIPVGGTTGILSFTPNITLANGLGCQDSFDSFDVYYPRQSFITAGTTLNFTCVGNGATGTTVSVPANGSDTALKTTVTCPQTGTFNVLQATVSGVQGGSNFGIVSAVGAFNSHQSRIRIDIAGQSGTTTANWTNAGLWQSLQHLTAYAADGAVVMLGINDAGASVTPASFASNIQTLITTINGTGSTILSTMVPSGATGTYQTFEPQYVSTGGSNSIYGLGVTNTLPVIDLFSYLGTTATGSSWCRLGDNLHPSANCYPVIGRFMANALQGIIGNSSTLKTNLSTPLICISSAAPAVCNSSSAGMVAIPTGVNPTLTVNTTAVTDSSQIVLHSDNTIGSKLGVTCNSTLATLVGGMAITAPRSPGVSFQISFSGTVSVNPVCVSFVVVN